MQSTSAAFKAAVDAARRTVRCRLLVDWDGDGSSPGDTLDDISGYATRLVIDRSLTTDTPDVVTLASGYASAKLTATLTGKRREGKQAAARQWSPFSADSPVLGKQRVGVDVVTSLGVVGSDGSEYVTIHTGKTTRLQVTSGASGSSATLEALDGGAERLNLTPNLPLVVGFDHSNTDAAGGLNSQWVVDYLARRGGYNASPPIRSNCVLSATLHGAADPERGSWLRANHFSMIPDANGENGILERVPYEPGVFALAPTPDHLHWYDFAYNLSSPISQRQANAITFSGWVFLDADVYADVDFPVGDPDDPDQEGVTLIWRARADAAAPTVWVQLGATSAGHSNIAVHIVRTISDPGFTSSGTTVAATGWHYLGVAIEFSSATAATVTYRLDGSVVATESLTGLTASGATDPNMTEAEISGALPCEAVQITTEHTTSPGFAWDNAFAPNSTLETGLLDLTAMPAIPTGATCWTLLQQIAAAEGAVVQIDETDVFRFWSRDHWRTAAAANTVQKTIAADTSLQDVQISDGIDRVRNIVQVAVSPISILPGDVIWQQREVVAVPARGSLTLTADLGQDQAYNISTFQPWVIPSGGPMGTFGQGRSGYRASRARDGSGGQITNLTMTVNALAAGITVTLSNPNFYPAWLVSPIGGVSPNGGGTYPSVSDGQPTVVIIGQLITTSPPESTSSFDGVSTPAAQSGVVVERRDDDSVDAYGEQVLPISASPWMQRTEDGDAYAAALLRDTHWPKPQIGPITIPADPSIQLGDRLQITHPDSGLDDPFVDTGLTTTFDASGMSQSISLRPVARPGQWILGVAGRSELGVTTVL